MAKNVNVEVQPHQASTAAKSVIVGIVDHAGNVATPAKAKAAAKAALAQSNAAQKPAKATKQNEGKRADPKNPGAVKIEKNVFTDEGFTVGVKYLGAMSKVIMTWVDGARFLKENNATDVDIDLFLDGFGKALADSGAPANQVSSRRSEYRAVIRTAMQGLPAYDELVERVRAGKVSRSGFLTECRNIKPAEGKGARTDVRVAAAPKAEAPGTPEATAAADKVQKAAIQKAAKQAAKRVDTAVKSVQEAIPAANASQTLALGNAAVGQMLKLFPTPEEKVAQLLGYVAATLMRVASEVKDADPVVLVECAKLVSEVRTLQDRVLPPKAEVSNVDAAIKAAAQDMAAQVGSGDGMQDAMAEVTKGANKKLRKAA